MSEWPKTHRDPATEDSAAHYELVIPADLGRELYEAAKRYPWSYDSPQSEAIMVALARYEREVGLSEGPASVVSPAGATEKAGTASPRPLAESDSLLRVQAKWKELNEEIDR